MSYHRLFFFCLTLTLSFADYYGNKVLLSKIPTLTLRSSQHTTGRRTDPIPQVKCVGGSAGCRFVPDSIQCTNMGSDGIDVQWECKADLEDIYRFGATEVLCEGYNSPDDEYILAGSCGVEFTLDYTEKGRRYTQNQNARRTAGYTYDTHYDSDSGSSTFVGRLITLGVCLALLYAIYLFCQQGGFSNNNGGGGGSGPYWGGGGGGGYSSGPSYYGQQGCAPTYGAPQRGGGGGFWTGAATGGLFGYLLGRRNNGYYNTGYTPNYYNSGYSAGPAYSAGPSFSASSFSSAPTTRSASAFASTRRR